MKQLFSIAIALAITFLSVSIHAQLDSRTYLKVCYLMNGDITDLGYNFAHNVGRVQAHKRFSLDFPNINLQSEYVVNMKDRSADQQKSTIQDFLNRGCEVMHAISASMTSYYLPFVKKYPNVTFSLATSPSSWANWGISGSYDSNLILHSTRAFDSWYQAGVAAAMNRKKCVGFIAALDTNAEIMSCFNSFMLGFQTVLPNEKVHLMAVGNFFDPPRADMAARSFHEGFGCDVIAEYHNSLQAAMYAVKNNLMAIEMHSIASNYYGDNVLTCVHSDWLKFYYDIALDRAMGRPPRSLFMYPTDITRLCDVSPRASTATFVRIAELANMTPVFSNWSFAMLNNVTYVRSQISPMAVHHGRPPLSEERCPSVGQVLHVLPSTTTIRYECRECPPQTAVIKGACVSCSVPEAAVTPRCQPKGMDIGPIVGPIVGVLGLILILFFVVVKYQRGELQRRTRDVTNAPKQKVTIIFTDIQSSTKLWESHPKDMLKAVEIHHTTVRKVIAKHKAYEVKTIGDSFMITVEGADNGVRVCNDIQSELLVAPWPAAILDTADACVKFEDNKLVFKGLRIRIGVETGTPQVVYDEVSKGYDYYGDVPNTAARVESIAQGGQTLITKAVYDQLSFAVREECNWVDVGEIELKGLTVKTHVYQVMPKHLTRNFSVPKAGTSAGGSEAASLRLNAVARKEDIEEMTMTEIASELRVLRAKYANLLSHQPAEDGKNTSVPVLVHT